ncbi:MAG: ribosome-binding factor A, partial [Holosporales bacterium]|nr:ribosome-binding factor A [Holosporales bacterium]
FVPEKKNSSYSRRNDKVAARVRECIAIALLRGDFPINLKDRIASLPPCQITITYVNMSIDLRNATIFFTISDNTKKHVTLKFFNIQTNYFKKVIATQIKLKFVPNISFKIDDSDEYVKRIETLLKQ